MCLLWTKNYENSHFNFPNYTGKICLRWIIYDGNDRIHIHVQNGEKNAKFRFGNSSWVNTSLKILTFSSQHKIFSYLRTFKQSFIFHHLCWWKMILCLSSARVNLSRVLTFWYTWPQISTRRLSNLHCKGEQIYISLAKTRMAATVNFQNLQV